MEAEHDAGLDPGRQHDAPNVDDMNDHAEVVRSEEVLNVSLDTQATERVTLRKRVVIDTVTQVVERRREELIIDRQPVDLAIGSADTATGMPADSASTDALTDADYEIVLYEERVIVTKEIVPIERVRLQKRVVTDVMQVQDEIRREHVEPAQAPLDDLD